MFTSHQAPVVIQVEGTVGAGDVAREYRQVDGRLFQQVWARWVEHEDRADEPDEAERRHDSYRAAERAWAPTVPGREYPLQPVPADEEWLRQTAERLPPTTAADEREAQIAVQEHLDQYAAIDGHVWRSAPEPVYEAPTVADAPFHNPLQLDIIPAPDTTFSAAPLNVFPADRYHDAVQAMTDTAVVVGVPLAPLPEDPPITWLRELGLIGAPRSDSEWRAGSPLSVSPARALTEAVFERQFGSFRQQVAVIPGAVVGDTAAFTRRGSWRLDFSALTAEQQQEYRDYVAFGVEHGFI